MTDRPGPATPTRTLTIPARGETLHAEWFAPHGDARGLAVVVHGYAEHIGRYREVANVLARDGWAVLGYDVRGHGKSSGKRGHVDRFSDYLDELDAVRRHARELADDAKVPARDVIVAHSHGSLITLRALTDGSRPFAVDAAVVSSPFLALRLPVSAMRRAAAKIASRIAPGFAQANNLRVEDLTADPEKQRERTADALCHSVATARWFTEAMAAQDFVAANIARIKVPTLWLVGGDDPIADPARSRMLGEHLDRAAYHHLDGLRHEVFNELARASVFEILVGFLRAQAAGLRLEARG